MKFTAQQIATILEGEIEGNPEVEVFKLSKIEEGGVGSLTFLANPKYNNYIYTTNASIVIVNNTFIVEGQTKATLIRVANAYDAFSKVLEYYHQAKPNKIGIESHTVLSENIKHGDNFYVGSFTYIGDDVFVGHNVKIYPNSFIGDNVSIGNNVTIFAGAKICSETVIGDNCIIHSGVVIGSDGFGFVPSKGVYNKMPQTGNVVIEDDVEIGACTTIDRATLGSTVIRKGVKLDNQIQIAHNVEIGENTVIAAQTGVAGSTKIGKNCMIAGQVGIAGHITIGNNVRIQAQSGVGKSVKDDEIIQGTPAFGYNDFSKSYIHFKNLPNIISDINKFFKNNKF